MKTLNTHVNYTIWEAPYQLSLPLNISFQIPDDDPVRLVKLLIERMDLSPLYHTYSRIEKNQASPRQLLAIVIYASMNQIFSSRRIESACRRDLNFQYLLEGKPIPNHATIARFRSHHMAACSQTLFADMDAVLAQAGALSLKNLFIDGTKIESVANKYTLSGRRVSRNGRPKYYQRFRALFSRPRNSLASKYFIPTLSIGTIYVGCWEN